MSRNWRPGQKEAWIADLIAKGRLPATATAATVSVNGVDDVPGEPEPPKKQGKRRRQMNATERDFFRYFTALQKRSDTAAFHDGRVVYEGLTLRWASADEKEELRYTCDFAFYTDPVGSPLPGYPPLLGITLIEVKGAHCWKQDLVRWKAAKIAHPQFLFQFWQKVDGQWGETR